MAAVWTVTSMITALQADGQTNVVQSVDWLCTDSDGTNTAIRGGTTVMAPPGPQFTPYDQLTEAQVIGWVQAALTAEQVASIEVDLADQLAYMQAPPVAALPLPWQG